MKGNKNKIRWDDPGKGSLYPDAFEFYFSRDEIAVLLGKQLKESSGPDDLMAQAVSRILMNPFSAKRLAHVLNRVIEECEAKYGSEDVPDSSPKGFGRTPSSVTPLPTSVLPDAEEKANLIFKLVQTLGVEMGFERSFKISQRSLLENRFLLGTSKGALGQHASENILYICERMGMPGNLLEDFETKIFDANYVHFGFEENETSCTYKVYLEFFEKIARERNNRPGQTGPFLLHLGYKWDVSDYSRHAVTSYTWYPQLSVDTIMQRLSTGLRPDRYEGMLNIAEGILKLSGQRISHRDILYLEVTEDSNLRKSFDINIYKAGLELGEIYPLLLKMQQRYEIPFEMFHKGYEKRKSRILGHLSGGIDRHGRDFLTVYYGVEGLGDNKERFDPLSVKPAAANGTSRYPCIPYKPDSLETESRGEDAKRLLQLVESLNVTVGCERSFKVLPNTLLVDRLLMGVKRNEISQDAHERLLTICRQMDMPNEFLDAFKKDLSQANIVLFAYERNEDQCLYKSYLEFAHRIEAAVKTNPHKPEPFVIHKGFKWNASNNSQKMLTTYTCYPLLSHKSIMERITSVLSGKAYRGSREIVRDILELAATRVNPLEFLYLEAKEEQNSRISFDVNMDEANLRMTEIYPFLIRITQYFDVPYEKFQPCYETVKTSKFCHLTGGLDREGREFLTVYFAEKRHPQ